MSSVAQPHCLTWMRVSRFVSWVESSVPQPDRKQANSKHAIAKHPRGGRRRVIVTVNVPDIYDQINFAQRSKNRTRQETPV